MWPILGLLIALLLTACQTHDGYFGHVQKRATRRPVFENLLPHHHSRPAVDAADSRGIDR